MGKHRRILFLQALFFDAANQNVFNGGFFEESRRKPPHRVQFGRPFVRAMVSWDETGILNLNGHLSVFSFLNASKGEGFAFASTEAIESSNSTPGLRG